LSGAAPRVRLIAIGHNIAGTGLTRVMHSLLRRLAERHEVHYLGIGYAGEIVRDRSLTIYPTNPRGGDVFAAFQAKKLIEDIHPAVVFILNDIWYFQYYLRLLGPCRNGLKIVTYIPLDGAIVREEDAAALDQADRVVTYTQFGRTQFEGAFRRLRDKQPARTFPAVDVIPHGLDRDRFFPFPDLTRASFAAAGRAHAKRRAFGEPLDGGESFVVLNASRPDKRKRVDLTLRGFAQFAAGKPSNVRLCLHHAIMDDEVERGLVQVIRECGIGERVSMNPLGRRVVDDAELNLLYNACDVGITTSMGEGWGLVSCEHGAAGAAQIVPDHTACAELWRGRAELVPPVRRYTPEFSVLEMGEVSAEGVAHALETLYRDPARAHTLARAAATENPSPSWDAVARQFEDLIAALAGAEAVRSDRHGRARDRSGAIHQP
jgi:glycosyltransferase involved in cell wall biosynthesis